MKKHLKTAYLILISLLLIAPSIQMVAPFIKEKELKGYFVNPVRPQLTLDSVMTGEFQEAFTRYLESEIGFYKFSVRLRNQLDAMFHVYHVEQLIGGKAGQYFNEFFAMNYLGMVYDGNKARQSVHLLEKFNKALSERNIPVLYVITPCKSSYMPENLPDEYARRKSDSTFYNIYEKAFNTRSVNFFDAQKWFLSMKDTVQFPLFNETGVHYTIYGGSLVKDSLLARIKELIGRPIPEYKVMGYEESTTARWDDDDIAKALNLLIPPPQRKLYYPIYVFDESTEMFKQPKVIFVTDSYFYALDSGYWNMVRILSDDSWHWYYFSAAYNFRGRPELGMNDIDVVKEVETADIVVFLGSIGTLEKFPFGLPEFYLEKKGLMN